jgi:hypothetical protein
MRDAGRSSVPSKLVGRNGTTLSVANWQLLLVNRIENLRLNSIKTGFIISLKNVLDAVLQLRRKAAATRLSVLIKNAISVIFASFASSLG